MEALPRWRDTLRSCWVFPVAVAWKFALALLFVLPPPANDAFFFDGAVVNWLLHGAYVNPSIARVFPTSATEFFSAYPPGYQPVLAAWMAVFGPSAQASLCLHVTLVSLYALLALALLRRARVPAAAANLGGCFLFGLTFHDRPDSVAHVLGLLALWCWTTPDETRAPRGRAVGALLAVLALATSLHIGAMYSAMLWGHAAMRAKTTGWPWRSMLAMVIAPVALVAAVVAFLPTAWTGFQENLLATPSFTGLRWPTITEVIKVVRNTPGLLVVTAFLLTDAARGRPLFRPEAAGGAGVRLFVPLLAAADFAVVANLFVVHPNYVWVAAFPQVLAVALWVALRPVATEAAGARWRTVRTAALAGAVLLISIRAVALTTWGVGCAMDVSQAEAAAEVRRVIADLPADSEALVSSAYLYALAGQQRVTTIHADWIGRYGEPGGAHPAVFVLTPFDYHRRYQGELALKQAEQRIASLRVVQHRRWPVPDEFPRLQRVVQHLSWAPVFVFVEWRVGASD